MSDQSVTLRLISSDAFCLCTQTYVKVEYGVLLRKRTRKKRTIESGQRESVKGELQPKISLLHMEVLILIKAKSNVFL